MLKSKYILLHWLNVLIKSSGRLIVDSTVENMGKLCGILLPTTCIDRLLIPTDVGKLEFHFKRILFSYVAHTGIILLVEIKMQLTK